MAVTRLPPLERGRGTAVVKLPPKGGAVKSGECGAPFGSR